MNEKQQQKTHASHIKYQPFHFTVCMYVNVFHFVTDVLHSEHSYMTFLTWQGPNMTSTDDKSRCKPAQKFITGSGGCSTREETEEVTRSLLSVAI